MKARFETLTDLWHKTAMHMFYAPAHKLDFIASIDTMLYSNLLIAESMEYDFDMGRDLWLNKSRFTVLQRDYLDLYEYELFLRRCESIGLGEAKRGVVTQMFAKQHARRAQKYRWGNCMLGFGYRGGNKGERPVFTLHSRVSYIAYIGGLDLALCRVMAQEISERVGIPVEEFRFEWYIDSLQFHGFKSLPFLYRKGHPLEALEDSKGYPGDEFPTIGLVRRWYLDAKRKWEEGVPLESEKYGPVKRIRRRFEEYQREEFMSTPLEELTLDPLRARG